MSDAVSYYCKHFKIIKRVMIDILGENDAGAGIYQKM